MQQTANIIDILSEDFIIPDCNCDLENLIEDSITHYQEMNGRKDKIEYKAKVNELIQEYNDRRNMKIYCKL